MKNILLVTLIPCLLLASVDNIGGGKQVESVVDKKEKNYEAVMNLLQTIDTKKEVSSAKVDKKVSNKGVVITQYKAEKYMLPIPKKSIIIGDKITVYADYKENVVEGIKQMKEGTQINMNIKTKLIKLNLGDRFGDWKLVWVGENYVRYKNVRYPQRFIKKYY